ncbi:aldehyde reductase [Fulvimarina sp. 2208YS6-2-32]|uniref:Aldehyde reductase n=1 Tax=Fulvimarina uroteuthidis TaxID=3098149 RepID=A0ABU5I5J3_9HYPH|nr:aldehyde reductase [Fulvimarina sp. 2208YS6-2-32]MDY8110668.1 aldehyde reductase [Fulvimarina sp. 2208YS6-2-32]
MTTDRVLLTGASGFVAKHICARLLKEGWRVRGTVRGSAKADAVRAAMSGQGHDPARLELVTADLTEDAGWRDAATGCRFVIHTASPFPKVQPKHRFGLVDIARGGTLRVLECAERAGVERVVLTSSVVAVYVGRAKRSQTVFGEADWTDVDGEGAYPYAVSKTLAERAAWAFADKHRLDLAVVNPGFVLGPMLDGVPGTSIDLIRTMLKGRLVAVPDAAFGIVDVRDVATAHVRAMTVPGAVGRRFLLSGGTRSLKEIGDTIGRNDPKVARRMPRFVLPDWLVQGAGALSGQVAPIVPELGRRKIFDSGPARDVLGLELRTADDAIASAARSVRERFDA